ncbi:MAG: carbonic anhydrase [Desulfarculus sp.]|nr:carbonic anhydrase [Pseudomonadota bacterium]MBV1716911.1 carbonic anhydrase [Desulfarculus sp.]MBU4573174.1 carbonic anhydrase [Pseudomonadota bacterium]MBU4596686.1 carbonic anhydrase [Pseudomonadota bacterium]MBV1738414.1 carbonic anhydrase [Desulfarculus sp.]
MSKHKHATHHARPDKPEPKKVLDELSKGNHRFTNDRRRHPRSGLLRRRQAHLGNQADHAMATVLSCSDSRVPVEMIFDVGIMDLFVVRTAGHSLDSAALASVEYGMLHVHTPLLVVLGHSNCGAVTAALDMVQNDAVPAEASLRGLLSGITPAVHQAMADLPEANSGALLDRAIEENVKQTMQTLFRQSEAIRDGVASGAFAAVGAIYDLAHGRVKWLEPGQPAWAPDPQDQAAAESRNEIGG